MWSTRVTDLGWAVLGALIGLSVAITSDEILQNVYDSVNLALRVNVIQTVAVSRAYAFANTANSNPSVNATQYMGFQGSLAPNNNEQIVDVAVPQEMTVKNLYCFTHTAPGGSASWSFRLRDDAADTIVHCTISGANTSCQDNLDSVLVALGSHLAYSITPTTSPTAAPVHCAAEIDS